MKAFFPVQCSDTLLRIALLVKQARLQQGVRQVDLAERLGISLRTFRRIEAGSADGVSLRDFMLVVWGLGVSERLMHRNFKMPMHEPDAVKEASCLHSDA
ncbi:helix-turn-helix domain-containing protein [Pseudomonas savastanoi]|uniref:helix-turn-helix domain-containing protein n=1 Tax=Pseudomonas savastanoi TaxID=29438 RepID=UPI002868BAAB|nr:helix-turn-helix transcriptional regulator [Pseudomonas savastanoi]